MGDMNNRRTLKALEAKCTSPQQERRASFWKSEAHAENTCPLKADYLGGMWIYSYNYLTPVELKSNRLRHRALDEEGLYRVILECIPRYWRRNASEGIWNQLKSYLKSFSLIVEAKAGLIC